MHPRCDSLNVVLQKSINNRSSSEQADNCVRTASLRLSNQPTGQTVQAADCIISCCRSKSDADYMQAQCKLNERIFVFLYLNRGYSHRWSCTRAHTCTHTNMHHFVSRNTSCITTVAFDAKVKVVIAQCSISNF